MGGAMSWISEHGFVSALSERGGFGVLACGSLTPDALAQEISLTQKRTKNPFGVNLILFHPQLDDLLEVCADLKVEYVIMAGGFPSRKAIDRIKRFDARAVCFAPTLKIGKKLIKMGIDALILEGMEAGGHIGAVSTSVLAQEILPLIREVPIFVGGGIGRGEAMLSYLRQGAAGIQIGTRLVCAHESIAHPEFKRAFIRAAARDATPSVQVDERFPIIAVRAIENQGQKDFIRYQREVIARFERGDITLSQGQLDIEYFWVGALKRAVFEGDVIHGSLMAGQSVGLVEKEQSLAEILDEFIQQADESLR